MTNKTRKHIRPVAGDVDGHGVLGTALAVVLAVYAVPLVQRWRHRSRVTRTLSAFGP